MIVMNNTSQGAEDILALRQALLPADGSVRWNVRYMPRDVELPIGAQANVNGSPSITQMSHS